MDISTTTYPHNKYQNPISTLFEVYTSSRVQCTGHSSTSDCGQELQVPSFHKTSLPVFCPLCPPHLTAPACTLHTKLVYEYI